MAKFYYDIIGLKSAPKVEQYTSQQFSEYNSTTNIYNPDNPERIKSRLWKLGEILLRSKTDNGRAKIMYNRTGGNYEINSGNFQNALYDFLQYIEGESYKNSFNLVKDYITNYKITAYFRYKAERGYETHILGQFTTEYVHMIKDICLLKVQNMKTYHDTNMKMLTPFFYNVNNFGPYGRITDGYPLEDRLRATGGWVINQDGTITQINEESYKILKR